MNTGSMYEESTEEDSLGRSDDSGSTHSNYSDEEMSPENQTLLKKATSLQELECRRQLLAMGALLEGRDQIDDEGPMRGSAHQTGTVERKSSRLRSGKAGKQLMRPTPKYAVTDCPFTTGGHI